MKIGDPIGPYIGPIYSKPMSNGYIAAHRQEVNDIIDSIDSWDKGKAFFQNGVYCSMKRANLHLSLPSLSICFQKKQITQHHCGAHRWHNFQNGKVELNNFIFCYIKVSFLSSS